MSERIVIETKKVLDSGFLWYRVRLVGAVSRTIIRDKDSTGDGHVWSTLYTGRWMARRAARKWLRSQDFGWEAE